jgi:hypothetical protein
MKNNIATAKTSKDKTPASAIRVTIETRLSIRYRSPSTLTSEPQRVSSFRFWPVEDGLGSLERTLYVSHQRCDEARGQGDCAIARRGGQHSQAGALPDCDRRHEGNHDERIRGSGENVAHDL